MLICIPALETDIVISERKSLVNTWGYYMVNKGLPDGLLVKKPKSGDEGVFRELGSDRLELLLVTRPTTAVAEELQIRSKYGRKVWQYVYCSSVPDFQDPHVALQTIPRIPGHLNLPAIAFQTYIFKILCQYWSGLHPGGATTTPK